MFRVFERTLLLWHSSLFFTSKLVHMGASSIVCRLLTGKGWHRRHHIGLFSRAGLLFHTFEISPNDLKLFPADVAWIAIHSFSASFLAIIKHLEENGKILNKL